MTSYREGANRRRNARQAKPADAPVPHQSGKNTKRWCRGKVGVEHMPKCVPYKGTSAPEYAKTWRELVCTRCGKQLACWIPILWMRGDGTAFARGTKPAWVDS